MNKLTPVQLAALRPIFERMMPAMKIIEDSQSEIRLILASWGIDQEVQINPVTGEYSKPQMVTEVLVPELAGE